MHKETNSIFGKFNPPVGTPFDSRTMDISDMLQNGLTLRDWFAGLTLSSGSRPPDKEAPENSQEMAALCYEMADAMLEARKKK